jgi:hypothetical protein
LSGEVRKRAARIRDAVPRHQHLHRRFLALLAALLVRSGKLRFGAKPIAPRLDRSDCSSKSTDALGQEGS